MVGCSITIWMGVMMRSWDVNGGIYKQRIFHDTSIHTSADFCLSFVWMLRYTVVSFVVEDGSRQTRHRILRFPFRSYRFGFTALNGQHLSAREWLTNIMASEQTAVCTEYVHRRQRHSWPQQAKLGQHEPLRLAPDAVVDCHVWARI